MTAPVRADRTPTLSPDRQALREAIAARDAAATSRPNRQLRRLVKLLRRAASIADRWVEAGHGPKCTCPYCVHRARVCVEVLASTAKDVAAAAWTSRVAADLIQDGVATTFAESCEYVERLKREREAEREADLPAIVEG